MLALLCAAALVPPPAEAGPPRAARVVFGCMPWDGRSVTLLFDAAPAADRPAEPRLELRLWGHGLAALAAGAIVEIPLREGSGTPDRDAAGSARVCAAGGDAAACSAAAARLRITDWQAAPGATMRGELAWSAAASAPAGAPAGGWRVFSGTVAAGRATCG